jgi:hypothetical protein
MLLHCLRVSCQNEGKKEAKENHQGLDQKAEKWTKKILLIPKKRSI